MSIETHEIVVPRYMGVGTFQKNGSISWAPIRSTLNLADHVFLDFKGNSCYFIWLAFSKSLVKSGDKGISSMVAEGSKNGPKPGKWQLDFGIAIPSGLEPVPGTFLPKFALNLDEKE